MDPFPDIGACQRSRPWSKPLISPGCARLECRKSDLVGRATYRPLGSSWQRAAHASYPTPCRHSGTPVTTNAFDEYTDRRDFAPADVCDHFASGRRQDDTDREIAAVWRGDPIGGRSEGARRAAAGALGLDGGRARARHLGLLGGDELRARGARLQLARHAGPPGFQPTRISARTPTGSG